MALEKVLSDLSNFFPQVCSDVKQLQAFKSSIKTVAGTAQLVELHEAKVGG